MSETTGETGAPEGASVAVGEAPGYKLFSVNHISNVSFFGGPLPGAWMMAANYKRLGETGKSRLASGLGALAIVVAVALNYVVTRKFGPTGNLPTGVLFAVAMKQLASSQQGRAIGEHQRSGGRMESAWKSLGIMLVGIAQTAFGAIVLMGWLQTSVVVGGTHKILVDGMATEADARRVGDVLTEIGALREGKQTEMSLEKDRSAWTVTIDVNEDSFGKPDLAQVLEPVVQQIRARALPDDGLKLKVVLASGLHRKRCELDLAEHLDCR